MSFFKASTEKSDVKQGGGGYITESGFYPVNIIAPVVSISDNGSTTVDLFIDHSDQKQILYGNLRITNNDGTPNKISSKLFNQLIIIADLENVADPVEATLPIGVKGKDKDVAVLEDLADLDVWIRIQMEYGVWKGSYTEKKVIKAFFRGDDKATAEEIVNKGETGAGFEKEQKYASHITYKDDTTPELIKAWISAKRPKGTAEGGTGSGSSGNTKKPAFSKKRFAGK